MATRTIKRAEPEEKTREERVRVTAYLNWEKTTGGVPVDDSQTRQFWLEAEEQVVKPKKSGNGSNGS